MTETNITNIQPSSDLENWTEILSPKTSLLDLRLREVWHYKDLLLLFVRRDFIAQYRQTVLGPIWHLIQPTLTTIMFMLVFNKIAGIQTDGLPAPLFYITSIAIWNYFQACLVGTSNTFTANSGIFGKVYFPRLVLPLATVASNIVKLGIQFILVIAVLLYQVFYKDFHYQFTANLLYLPVIIVTMALMGLGLGIIISSVTTKYRDFTVLIGFGVQLLMYVTPVPYPMSYLQNKSYASFIEWNPLSPLVEGFRYSLFGVGTFNIYMLLYSVAFAFISVFAGVLLFNKVERSFMDTV